MGKFRNLLMAVALVGTAWGAHAAEDPGEPAITLKTSIYEEKGAANAFSILLSTMTPKTLDIDMGWGLQEIDVVPATVVDGAWQGTWISCNVSSAGQVKIYGDPADIDVFMCGGAFITDIDVSKCSNLDVISLEHNQLKGLDLTPNTKLRAIYLGDNPGSPQSPIKIGGPKNELQILEIDIIDNIDPDFSFTGYPKLITFDGYATKGITKADLSNCHELRQLVLEMTSVETLDLTPCPKLTHLNVSEARVSHLDLSKVPELQSLLCGHASGWVNTDITMPHLDLSHNPKLNYLSAQENGMETLDLTNNPLLQNVYLGGNNLNTLNLEKNTKIVSLDIKNNLFTFSTLPPDNGYLEYFYGQRPFKVNRSYAKGATMSFPEMLRPETQTFARVMRNPVGEEIAPVEIDASAYTFSADGKLVFNTVQPDSVYVEFANSAFSEYSLTTTPFVVKEASEMGKPSPIISFMVGKKTPLSFNVGMAGATQAAPRKLLVDFGNGTQQEFNVTSADAATTVSGTPAGFNITLYAPENEVITAFDIENNQLVSTNFVAATELRTLRVNGCQLNSVDLKHNRCLESLDLANNNLKTLDLKGVRGDYEKWLLTTIDASNNKLTDCNILTTTSVINLNLSHNELPEFFLKDYDNLENLDLSHNKLTTLLMSYLANARNINLTYNALVELENVVEMPYLNSLSVENNKFTLGTIPYLGSNPGTYTYAPQAELRIPNRAPSVNLSAQNRVIDDKGTVYTWKTIGGATLVSGTDYAMTDDGTTRFLKTDLGDVYCEMTNPAFPDFAGTNVFRTSNVTPMGAPTTLVATFTTPEAVANGDIVFTTKDVDAIYIDWRGDNMDFVPYETKDTYTRYEGVRTYAGAKVKVYTYNNPSDVTVFSMTNVPMSEFDGSYMSGLHAFTLSDTGIDPDKITYPSNCGNITELYLEGANFTSFDFGKFPNVEYLSLSNNKFTSFDATQGTKLQTLYLNGNELTSVKLDNRTLWGVDLANNKLSAIDLSKVPALEQISLDHNLLSEIDITPVKNSLKGLSLTHNYFTFATLPVPADYPALLAYFYDNQAELAAELVDNKVDLSSQAQAGGVATTYQWFLDGFQLNPDTGLFEGEELYVNDEYTIENGVTTFLTAYDKPVQCLLLNEAFPNLYMSTPLIYMTSINDVEADSDNGLDAAKPVDVYNLQGVLVRRNVLPADALTGLTPGLYIVGGKKVLVR